MSCAEAMEARKMPLATHSPFPWGPWSCAPALLEELAGDPALHSLPVPNGPAAVEPHPQPGRAGSSAGMWGA